MTTKRMLVEAKIHAEQQNPKYIIVIRMQTIYMRIVERRIITDCKKHSTYYSKS